VHARHAADSVPNLARPVGLCPVGAAQRDARFRDEDEIRQVYYPEAEHLIASATRASRVVIFDHTLTDGRARFLAHTSFTDPTTPPDAPPRESIELRTLVFHPA
jgi:hypothetical protein